MPAMANWQYDGVYVGDGWYEDDGARFVLSFRGGGAAGFGTIKNNVGALSAFYYVDASGAIVPETVCQGNGGCSANGYELLGYGDISSLKPTKDFETFSFAGGVSVGWTLPGRPQWRFEGGWDHIMKSDYNASPLFEGDMQLYDGAGTPAYVLNTSSGALHSTIESDIISAMAFYDFFDGLQKPLRTTIPYVGFGIGYADTITVTNLTDLYGDLSADNDLRDFGTLDEDSIYEIVNFYQSKHSTSNVAGLLAAGFSYGLDENMYIDFGARLTYIPKAKWTLTNEDGTRHRDLISSEDLIYLNFTLGLRFEF